MQVERGASSKHPFFFFSFCHFALYNASACVFAYFDLAFARLLAQNRLSQFLRRENCPFRKEISLSKPSLNRETISFADFGAKWSVDLFALMLFVEHIGSLAVLDFETTGLDPAQGAEILEIGAVLLDAKSTQLTTVHSLVRVQGEIPPGITRLTGICPDHLREAPRIEEVKQEIADLLRGRVILAHNAEFEKKFLGRWIDSDFQSDTFSSNNEKMRYLDTQDLLAVTYPDTPTLRLDWFTAKLLGRTEQHRGLEDAIDTLCVLAHIAEGAHRGRETRYGVVREALQNYAPQSPWLALLADAKLRLDFASHAEFIEIDPTKEVPVPFDADAIAAALRDVERGRRHFENYQFREGQVELARKFVLALSGDSEEKITLLEGGTGIGKSLAYLAAAIPYAMETAKSGDRRPVVISTRTKLLQDQLLKKDIAAAARFLGYPDLRAIAMKGRANYACARRLQSVLEEGCDRGSAAGKQGHLFSDEDMAYATLFSASQIRVSGELGSIASGIRRRFVPLSTLLRHSVSYRSDQCTREQCAASSPCAFGKKRAALSQAHLIVANHDLLLRWPPDYPSFTHLIVDEVHELAGVADEAYAQEVAPEALLDDFDEAFGNLGKGKKTRALVTKKQLQVLGEEEVRRWRRELDQDSKALGRLLGAASTGCADEYGGVPVSAFLRPVDPTEKRTQEAQGRAVRFHKNLPKLREHAEILSGRLQKIAQELDKICEKNTQDECEVTTLNRVVSNFKQAAENLSIAFLDSTQNHVISFEDLRSSFDRWRLVLRPVLLEERFREELLSKLECFVGVSASLFVGAKRANGNQVLAQHSFAALGEIGISAQEVQVFAVPSPFPYVEQMRVVALRPSDGIRDFSVPDTANVVKSNSTRGFVQNGFSGDELLKRETVAVLADLARTLDGRTLGLFTNLKRMNEVADLLAETLREDGIEILTPRAAGDDPAQLVERFRKGRCVLLGARSFWQGLDIAGDALQAVVIEKYPFEVPTELRKRREARLKETGMNTFEIYTLAKMMLYLKQMVGRLIRSENDRGIVVIVEGRTDKGYFKKLDRALPAGSKICVAQRSELGKFLRELGIGKKQ